MKKFLIILSIMQMVTFASHGVPTSAIKTTVEKTAIARPSDATGKKVMQIIADFLVIDIADVKYGDKLTDDLGADEIDVVEIIMKLEKAFDIVITDQELDNVEKGTVNDLLKLVRAKVSSKR